MAALPLTATTGDEGEEEPSALLSAPVALPVTTGAGAAASPAASPAGAAVD